MNSLASKEQLRKGFLNPSVDVPSDPTDLKTPILINLVPAGLARVTLLAWQKILDAFPLVVSQ